MGGLGTLAALEGEWALSREIAHADGARHVFRGTARFHWQGGHLVQDEEGALSGLPGGGEVRATRRYLWREADGLAEILFDDLRPFHAFPLDRERPGATHHCDPDIYHVAYDFDLPRAWRARWSVEGPRKSYVMDSRFRREDDTAP